MHFDEKFWVAFSFILLIILIFRPIKSALTKGLDDYSANIKKSIDEAAAIKAEAEAILKDCKHKTINLKNEISDILKNAENQGKFLKDEFSKNFANIKESKLKSLEINILANRNNIIRELYNKAIEEAASRSYLIIQKNLNAKLSAKLIDQSIEQLDNIKQEFTV
jgi:F-type H+-transporting ATPase subunit b